MKIFTEKINNKVLNVFSFYINTELEENIDDELINKLDKL